MPAIDGNFAKRVRQALMVHGIDPDSLALISADGDAWRYAVVVGVRRFEISYSLREGVWARETTAGAINDLSSNEDRRVYTPHAALDVAARLVGHAYKKRPLWRRDPPVL